MRKIEVNFSSFILEGGTLNVINPIACSLILPHWSIASIIADIHTLLSSVLFGL